MSNGITLQVRGVSTEDVAVLRARARHAGISLSEYLRDLIHQAATQPSNAEAVARIEAEEPIEFAPE